MALDLIAAIYRTLDVPDSRGDVLEPLAAVVAIGDTPARSEALRHLARVLNQGTSPGVLADLLAARSTVLQAFRYERSPDWRYGTHSSRRQLIDELWGRAAQENDVGFARAAFLLAVEQGFAYGVATTSLLLADAHFESLTRWGAPQVAAVRALLEEERRRTSAFLTAAIGASRAIEAMIARAEGMDDAHVLSYFTAAERMAELAPGRADVQMRTANLLWRVANLARSRNRPDVLDQSHAAAARWRTLTPDVHFARWLEEALHAPAREIRTAGARRVKTAEFAFRREP